MQSDAPAWKDRPWETPSPCRDVDNCASWAGNPASRDEALRTYDVTTHQQHSTQIAASLQFCLQKITPQLCYGPFSGTTRVSQCQKGTSGHYGARED